MKYSFECISSLPVQPGLVSLGLWQGRRHWWWWCVKHWSISQPWGPRPSREAALCTHSDTERGKTLPEKVRPRQNDIEEEERNIHRKILRVRGQQLRTINLNKSHHVCLFLFPSHLFPCSDGSTSEDEDYGNDIQRPPDEEGKGSSTAPHSGQPGQADQQDGTQTENHTHHWQSSYMDMNVLCRGRQTLRIRALMDEQSGRYGMLKLNL